MDVELVSCACGPRLVAVHPDAPVRAHVLAVAGARLRPLAVARPEHLRLWLAPGAGEPLVVALDPARTPAHRVRGSVPAGTPLHLLSISDLRLDQPDPAVDSVLPRRRLTRAALERHLRVHRLEATACSCGATTSGVATVTVGAVTAP